MAATSSYSSHDYHSKIGLYEQLYFYEQLRAPYNRILNLCKPKQNMAQLDTMEEGNCISQIHLNPLESRNRNHVLPEQKIPISYSLDEWMRLEKGMRVPKWGFHMASDENVRHL